MAFPKNGPKDWSPNKIQQILEGLESFTVDTSWHQGNLHPRLVGVVDIAPVGKLSGFHVTDYPESVAQGISHGNLPGHGGTYGCAGLVVSARPKDFKAVSRKKWAFLSEMPEQRRFIMEDLIKRWINSSRMNAYITNYEAAGAQKAVDRWLETGEGQELMLLTQQPYNIDIAGIAERNALAQPFKPYVVTVIFEGRYLENTSEVQYWSIPLAADHLKKDERDVEMADLCRTWKDLGWDGLFGTGRSGADPAHVEIWNPEKILSYGTIQETTRLSGKLSARRSGSSGRLSGKDAAEGGTTQAGRRFMSSLSPSMKMAMIQEVSDRSRMFGPMRRPAMQDLKETVERLRMGLEPEPGRFKVDLSKQLPEIVDTEVYRRIRTLSSEDIAELSYLVDEILTEMEA